MTQRDVPLVAFNAHLLAGNASYRSAGISNYIDYLLRHLVAEDDAMQYMVFLGSGQLPAERAKAEGAKAQPGAKSGWKPGGECSLRVHRSQLQTERAPLRILWEQTALPWQLRRLNVNLLHAPAFVGPLLAPCPQVITVHDLSFLRYPQFFQRSKRLYLRTMTGIACRRSAAVIAVSHFTAQEVATLLKVPPARIHVIHHGVDPKFRPLPSSEIARFREREGLPERFILHLGTLEPRKNIITLVRAFARLKEPDVHLVLAGGKGWLYEQIFDEVTHLGLQERVHFPGYIPANTQTLWYNTAYVFAYISNYEGFGLPVLESLACGTPTLTSETTALPEAAGDGALTVSPEDIEAVTVSLQRLLHDSELREALRNRGLAHAARFSWKETAQQTSALYRHVLNI